MPMHPFWQIKQAVRVDGLLHIDRCGVIGGRKTGDLWVAFNGLVTWIAREIKSIAGLLVYSDDSFGINPVDDMTMYLPYHRLLPTNQFHLLSLWDELGLPHKDRKQVSGSPLPIIGIEVDPNRLTYTLSSAARKDLIDEMAKFCRRRVSKAGRRTGSSSYPLKQWQRLAGWLNWSFNVFPLLRPGLSNVYQKISGKSGPNDLIFVNNAVRDDLSWTMDHMSRSSGVHIVRSLTWEPGDADITIFCDACLSGMGFWYPKTNTAFFSVTPVDLMPSGTPAIDRILPYEFLCVVTALRHASFNAGPDSKIVIYTDSLNTVDIFSTLRAKPLYNTLLRYAIDILIDCNLYLRVLHVPGSANTVADHLSRGSYRQAIAYAGCHPRSLQINAFAPPPVRLGSLGC
jgi:hypothetical protein